MSERWLDEEFNKELHQKCLNMVNTTEKEGFERKGVRWSPEEDEELYQKCLNNTAIEDISKEHKRTVKAIEMRIAHLATLELEKNRTIQDVSTLFNIPVDTLKEHFQEIEKKTQERKVKKTERRNETPVKEDVGQLLTEIRDALKVVQDTLVEIRNQSQR